jgi:hypothetical protein
MRSYPNRIAVYIRMLLLLNSLAEAEIVVQKEIADALRVCVRGSSTI